MAAKSLKPIIGYIRVSTSQQGRSGLGIAAQDATLGGSLLLKDLS